MKKLILLPLAALLLTILAFSQDAPKKAPSAKKAKTEQELLSLLKESDACLVRKDINGWSRLLAEDFIGTYNEDVFTKAELFAMLQSGEDVILSAEDDDVQIRVYDNMAIIIGRTTVQERYKGKDISGQHRFTDTFIRRGGTWLMAAEHWSKISGK